MATTFDDLKRFMDEPGFTYDADDEHQAIAIGFSSEPEDSTYRDADGDPDVQLIVRLAEQGEFVAVFAPRAWRLADCEHRQAVCEAATRIQSVMKLIRFDVDEEANLTPNIEVPLEQAPMCSSQLHRAIAGVLLAIRRYDAVFRHAMQTGEVDLTLAQDDEPPTPPPEVMRILELGDDAGGLEALEQLLGGGDAPPVES